MALDMNYTPTRLVDITTLTEDQWLDWRKKGIGGSDVAAALNMSPYRTARDLYYDKIGVVPAVEGPDKSITFQIGHLLEDVVAQIFAKKTGLTVYEDHWMYQHPLYPFLIADVDRFVLLPDGRKAILECKTAHYDMQFKWANGAVPRHYELQVRHYMSVMNIDVAFIACLFSNNENDFVWQKIERDVEEEENTILALEAFWNNHVLARVEPPLVEKPDAVLESLRRFFGPDCDTDAIMEALHQQAETAFQAPPPKKPGLDELIAYLEAQHIPMVVASSSRMASILRHLNNWHMTDHFKALISGEQFSASKPDPEIFLTAAKALGTVPAETLVLEDSYNGVSAGARGGFVTVMVPDLAPADDEMRRLYTAECKDLREVKKMLEEGKLLSEA